MSSFMSVPDALFANYAAPYKAPKVPNSYFSSAEEYQNMKFCFQNGSFVDAKYWAMRILRPVSNHTPIVRELAEEVKNICSNNITTIENAKQLHTEKKYEEVVTILLPILSQYPHLLEVKDLYQQAEWFAQIRANKKISSQSNSSSTQQNSNPM